MSREFRLKKVHELRQREVEQETVILAEYNQEVDKLEQYAERLDETIQGHREEVISETRAGMSPTELRQHSKWMRSLMDARRDLEQRRDKAEDRVEEQREVLLELHRSEQMLETLKEKHEELMRKEELRQLEKELGDIRIAKFQPKGGDDSE
jgi:flagellar export protein FliJ